MSNHKRGKSRRSIRCSMCTPHRWLGNHKDRLKPKDSQEIRDKERLRHE